MPTVICAHCGKETLKRQADINRAAKSGSPLYCGKTCFGLSRRKPTKTAEQRKAEKATYDREYRAKNLARIKADKKAWYAANFNREKERAYRQKRMAHHVEYCRRPEYRAKKREYDKEYRAKAEYGEFWECFLLSMSIHDEAVRQAGGEYELLLAKGYFERNAQQRRRAYERLNREEPENVPLGDLERRERR